MHIEVYKDKRGEWRWRAKARNGKIIADGAEGYKSKRNVLRALTAFSLTLNHAAFLYPRVL